MSDIKVMTPLESAEAKSLAAFATELIGPELARLGLTAELRRCADRDGYEFVCTYNYTGVVFIDANDLRSSPVDKFADVARELRQVIEAIRVGISERLAL